VLRDFPYVREPRLTVIGDDGRNYLAATRNRYDVIISEPSNPWLTGVSDLFTRDHFVVAKRKLRPGGVYCQWAQLYELSPQNVQTLYRTFAENFRYVVAFSAEDQSSDTILIGSDTPLPFDLARIAQRLSEPAVNKELKRAHISGPEAVIARVLLSSREEIMKFTAGAPINTDDNARIELAAPHDLIGFQKNQGYLETMYSASWPYGRVAERLEGVGSGAQAAEHLANLALALLGQGRKAEVETLLERARRADASYESNARLAQAIQVDGLLSGHIPEPDLGIHEDPTPQLGDARSISALHKGYAAIAVQLEGKHFATAVGQLEALPTRLRRGGGQGWALFESYVRYKAGHYDGAIDCLEDVLRTHPDFVRMHYQLYYLLARAHAAEQHFGQAVSYIQTYVAGPSELAAASPTPPPPAPGGSPGVAHQR
jgi:tetratricopeptide (TPR) repeat protein